MTYDPRLAPHRLPALVFAVFLLVIAFSAAVLFAGKVGPGPRAVAEYYRGAEARPAAAEIGSTAATTGPGAAEERFAPAKSFDGLLLVAVPHLVAIPLVLFAAAHVVGFARTLSRGGFRVLVALSFGSALASVAAGFLVRFATPGAAWLAIGAFAGLEVALLCWSALLGAVFLPVGAGRARPRKALGGAPAADGPGAQP